MTLGFVLMVFGMLGYIGGVLFSLMTQDIDELRLATILSFLSVISFMLGSILEVKELSNLKEQDKPEKVKKVYLTDLRCEAIIFMIVIIAIGVVILLMCLLYI